MSYIDPSTVVSPKNIVGNVEVVFDAGPVEGSWAVATLSWQGSEVVGIRWNGGPRDSGIGTPQARGIPTWFILPDEVQDAVLEEARKLAGGGQEELKTGYRDMAADQEREHEAHEWIEGLLGEGRIE